MSPDRKMTAHECEAARAKLGLTQEQLAGILRVDGDRTVRRWESEERKVPGPVAALLDLLLACPAARRKLGITRLH